MVKEECLNAIDVIARYCSEVKQGHIPPRFELTDELDVLMQLINEHFDNPPLKFEELHEGMWVWDNYYKIYVRVTETLTLKTLNSNDETFIVRVAILTPSLDVTLMSVVYDKYRFYKYEVENDAK